MAHVRSLATQTDERDDRVQLSILLYSLAGYYQRVNRHSKVVACYRLAVALDEATGHEDLAADCQALAQTEELATPATSDQTSVPLPD